MVSGYLDPKDSPDLQSRGALNSPIARPNGKVPHPTPDAQPKKTHPILPENEPEILADFVKRFKLGDWNPNLEDVAEQPPKRRALVIALNYEGSDPRVGVLRGTYVDARRVIHTLETKLDYDPEEICVLADIREPFSEEQGRPRWPSRENIHTAIAWLTHGTTTGDYRFLFVGSHGHRQIRAQKENGRQTFISNEGIMLREHEFISFNQCESCECQDRDKFRHTFQETWAVPKGPKFIPEPRKVLYDYELNESLARSLGPGAKLTVLFDCCYSGGTLSKTLPGSVNATQTARGGSAPVNGPLRLSEVPDSRVTKPFGNILCLPLQASVGVEVARAPVSKPAMSGSAAANEPFISSCYSLPNISAVRVNFHEDCEVICWAACKDIEYSWGVEEQEEMWGYGYFSLAFTEMFSGAQLPTYRTLNRHIQDQFQARNKGRIEKNKQHPKLFVSHNLAKDDEWFKSYLDSLVII